MTHVREGGDGDLHLLVRIREETDALTATTVEDQRVFMRQTEAPLFLLAGDVAFGLSCRFPPERDSDLDLRVLPEHRRRGIGTALYERLLEHARAQGWRTLMTSAIEEEALAWLARRGWEQVDRQERVVLELTRDACDTVSQAPVDIELTDYRERPDLAPKLVEVTAEALGDVPGELAREPPPSLETWLRWQEAPSRRPEFVVIALVGDDVAGYAQLNVYPRVGYHSITAVARAHRRRGVARTLKEELIRRACARGLERLFTNSNVDNVPMRTLNAALGYEPVSPRIYLRLSVAP